MSPGETAPEDLLARTQWTCSKQTQKVKRSLKVTCCPMKYRKRKNINFYVVTLHDMSILRSGPQARHKIIHIFVKIIPSVKLQ